MRSYKKITFLENNRRLEELINFRENAVQYFNSLEDKSTGLTTSEPVETDRSRRLRSEINQKIEEISEIVYAEGVDQRYVYNNPVYGIKRHLHPIRNIFDLVAHDASPDVVVDTLDRTIGVYESNRKSALIRTLNPIFWIVRLIDVITDVPFRLLEPFGYGVEWTRKSRVGGFFKGLLNIVIFVAGTLEILKYTGLLTPLSEWITSLIEAVGF